MASIVAKKSGNKSYYWVVTSQRVNGKPRIVHQTYLGTADRVADIVRSRSAPVPLDATALDLGLPGALWQVALRSGAFDALLSVWPAPRKGPSIPHYLLLAAIHRICDPGPKTAVADWYQRTVLRRLWGFSPKRFTSQAFWDHFDAIAVDSEEDLHPAADDLERAQAALLCAFRDHGLAGRRVLAYDTTNFHTWIATTNERSSLAARGRNKQKRNDLRQVGLSYALDAEHGLGLCHHVYRGDVSDSGELPAALERITRLLDGAGIARESVTLVMDKGSAALANTLELERQGLGWVAALPWNQAPDPLRRRPAEELEAVGGEAGGVRAGAERAFVHGAERLCVVRHSANFAAEQLHSWSASLAQATKRLQGLAREAARPGTRHTEQGLRGRIERWLEPNRVSEALSYELRREGEGWQLTFSADGAAGLGLCAERFGRTTLVTNRLEWSAAEVVQAYARQEGVEQVFRGLKGGGWLGWGAMHHWTDSKIRVHAFYCMLGVSLLQEASKRAERAWPGLTAEGLKRELGQIQQFELLYPRQGEKGPPRVATVAPKRSLAQQRLAEELGIDELVDDAVG